MQYPPVYHAACNHLVTFGAHGGDTAKGRKLIARALKVLRKSHGREFAREARYGMLFISGMFPVK
tara:strand:+ start:2226 stop:2420 length:195 start_codon:yes stop_codon:yes gene_type:complete